MSVLYRIVRLRSLFSWCVGLGLLGLWAACGPDVTKPKDELIFLPEHERVAEVSNPAEPAPDVRIDEPAVESSSQPEPLDAAEQSSPDGSAEGSVQDVAPEPPIRERVGEPTIPDASAGAWIGEPCTDDAQCAYPGGFCLKQADGFPDGHCSKACTSTCPDRAGKAVTFCVEDAAGQGTCVSRCEKIPCRKGYDCTSRARFGQPGVVKPVCLPKTTGLPGSSISILYIGDSQSSGTKFAQVMVSTLRNPKQVCGSTAKTNNNKVYSYARVSSAARHWSELSGPSKNWLCRQTTIYTNGTAPQNTTGAKLCAGITNVSKSVFQKLIDDHKPTAFLIQLGGNSLGFSESYVKSRMTRMLDQMPTGSLCFWVATTYATKSPSKHKQMEQWAREALAAYSRISCVLLTSYDEMSKQTTCTPYNAPDGLHLTRCGSQLWGQLIQQKLCKLQKL